MPGPRPSNQPLPAVPLSFSFQEWYQWAQGVIAFLQQFAFDFDAPGSIPSATATANNLAIVLSWEPAKKASAYRIYRGRTGDFNTASLIAEVPASRTKVAQYTWQDSQDSRQAMRFYWIVPVNTQAGKEGPRSAMIEVSNFASTVGSTAAGVDSIITGDNSTAFGFDVDISGNRSVGIGNTIRITHDDAVLIGNNLTSTENGEIQIGPRFTVNSSGEIIIDGVNVTEQLTSLEALPFQGPLGSGIHGALTIGSNTTATETIYQLTTLTVESGFTWTALQQNPCGLIVSVQGACSIGGTIDVNYLGGSGGAAITTVSNGRNGKMGYNYGGTGGGGGGATFSAGSPRESGGHGGPNKTGNMLSGWNVGGLVRATSGWFGDQEPSTDNEVRHQSGAVLGLGGTGGISTGGSATAGNSFAVLTDTAGDSEGIFDALWGFFRQQLFGWGAGGASGAADTDGGAVTGGVGGNGGGYLVILCNELTFSGTINANGEAGDNGSVSGTSNQAAGGGGGGGGGCVIIGYRTLVSNTGTINVNGGSAGTSDANGTGVAGNGGAGGAGFSNVFAIRM